MRIGALRGCTRCRKLFASDNLGALSELVGPVGVRVRWRPVRGSAEAATTEAGYRSAPFDRAIDVILQRRWWPRWGLRGAFGLFATCFLTFWGGAVVWGTAVGLADGRPVTPSVVGIALGLVVLILAALLGRMTTALLVNQTTLVIGPSHVERYDRPIRWTPPARAARQARERAIVEVVYENDVRNLSARWPAPPSHQLRLVSAGREPLVVFDQIARAASAERVRVLLQQLLDATDPSRSPAD